MKVWIPVLIMLVSFSGCKGRHEDSSIIVFAGSISKPFLDEAAHLFEEKYGINVAVEYGGSGNVLARAQISGKGDIYIAGSPEFMDIALSRGLVERSSLKKIVCLKPALVYRKSSISALSSLSDALHSDLKVAVADPDTVCLGKVAVKVFKREGLLQKINEIRIRAHSCMGLLRTLIEGNADVVIGWNVFARMFPEKLSATLLKNYGIYSVTGALLKSSRKKKIAVKFLNFLTSREVRKIAADKGFSLCTEETK